MRWRPSGAAGARFQSRRSVAFHAEHLLAGGHEDFKRADGRAQQPEVDGGDGAQRAGADGRFQRALGEHQRGQGRFRGALVPGNADLLRRAEERGQPGRAVFLVSW